MNELIILGAGGHGKVCANIASDLKKWDKIFFLDDDYPNRKECVSYPIIGNLKEFHKFEEADFFVAIGNNNIRRKYIELLKGKQLNIISLIHPSSYIGKNVAIGFGTSVHQNVVINTDSTIGIGCIINTSSIIEHENSIEKFVHMSPNTCTGGQVNIGDETWIGLGTGIINNISICDKVVVGAHSLVLKNINKMGTYIGNPVNRIEDK